MTQAFASHTPPDPAAVAAQIRAVLPTLPTLAIVLGSGFAPATHAVEAPVILPYSRLPGFPATGVPGHPGTLVAGTLDGSPVLLLAGRAHHYEGHDLAALTFPIRVLAALGIRALLLTNAAGGIRGDLAPGTLVAVSDHLNFIGANPLRGPGGPERFVDLSAVYSPGLRHHLAAAAAELGIPLPEGVYAAVAGPSYETPAEIRALRTLGADMVGMSTVPEAIVARQCGLEVAGLSCITNRAAGLGGPISHGEVLSTGRAIAATATALFARFARRTTPGTSSIPDGGHRG